MNFKKILLYGAETWTCTKREESKIQATEMKFFRAIMGKTKRDRIRNAHIRDELRMEELQNQIKGKRLLMVRTCQKNDGHRIQKRLLEIKMTGKRPCGRP
jgi:hypothetical protein